MFIDIKNHVQKKCKMLLILMLTAGICYLFYSKKDQIATEATIDKKLTIFQLAQPHVQQESALRNITVQAIRLSKVETKKLFQKQGKKFLRTNNDIIPLRLIVENNTSKSILIRPPSESITDINIIHSLLEVQVGAVTTAATIGGLLLAGPIGAIAFGVGFGRSSVRKNERIQAEIAQKIFITQLEVPAHGALNKIILMKSSSLIDGFFVVVDSCQHKVKINQ